MKVKVNEVEKKDFIYPRIMKGNGITVLFYKPREGTVIAVEQHRTYIVGEYNPCWDMSSFVDFNGSITLSND